MKQARRTCACVYACAVGLALALPGQTAESQANEALTPTRGLDLARAQFAAAAVADVILEDRWLIARHGAQLAPLSDGAAPLEDSWSSRLPVNVPGQYLLRDRAGECLRLELAEPFVMGFAGQPTYLSVTARLEPLGPLLSRGLAATVAASPQPRAATLAATELALPLRPDLFCFGPDGSGLVADARTGSVARLDLRDGTVLAQTTIRGAVAVALVSLGDLVYRFDTAGRVERLDALTLAPASPLQLSRRSVLELAEVRAAFADVIGQRIIVVGSRALWAVSTDGSIAGPRPAGEEVGELTGLGGGIAEGVLWLAARDAAGGRRAVPVALDTLAVGAPVELLPAGAGLGSASGLAVDAGGGLLVASGDGKSGFLRHLQPGGEPRLVPAPEFATGPSLTLSSDGRRIALWQAGGSRTDVVVRGAAPFSAADAYKVASGRPAWVAFSPDDRWILLGEPAERQLRVVPAEPERLTTVALAKVE